MPTPNRSAIGCITIPFLLLALVPLAWGARARWSDGVLLRNGVTVPGRVVEMRHVSGNPTISGLGRKSGKRSGVSPVVEFTTAAGERRTAVGSINRSPAEFKVGEAADVVYDPADPARADVRVELERWWFWCAIWSAVGAALAAVASLPFLLQRRAARFR